MRIVSRTALMLGFVAAVSGVPLGCSSGVVGGECRQGFLPCAGHCIDVSHDPDNCGACGKACPASLACIEGLCASPTDAGPDGGQSHHGSGGTDGGHSESGGAGGSAGGGGVDSGGNAGANAGGAGGSIRDGGTGGAVADAADSA